MSDARKKRPIRSDDKKNMIPPFNLNVPIPMCAMPPIDVKVDSPHNKGK